MIHTSHEVEVKDDGEAEAEAEAAGEAEGEVDYGLASTHNGNDLQMSPYSQLKQQSKIIKNIDSSRSENPKIKNNPNLIDRQRKK